jgi:hypothetical protein
MMHESKIEQLNSASMRVRKSNRSEKLFFKTQETFSPKAFLFVLEESNLQNLNVQWLKTL